MVLRRHLRLAGVPDGVASRRHELRRAVRGRVPGGAFGLPRAWRLTRLGLSLYLFLLDTSAVQRAAHRFISFVARVLVDLVLGALHEQYCRPGPRPRCWIVDRGFVLESVR